MENPLHLQVPYASMWTTRRQAPTVWYHTHVCEPSGRISTPVGTVRTYVNHKKTGPHCMVPYTRMWTKRTNFYACRYRRHVCEPQEDRPPLDGTVHTYVIRVPFQMGSKHNVWWTVFLMFRVPCSCRQCTDSSRSSCSLRPGCQLTNLEPGTWRLPRTYGLTSLLSVLEPGTCKTTQNLWTDQLTVSTRTWNLEPGTWKLPWTYGLTS